MGDKKYLSLVGLSIFFSKLKEWLDSMFVKKSTTINEKELSSDINLTPSDIGLSSEIWTFTLEDGSTVIKEVVIKK